MGLPGGYPAQVEGGRIALDLPEGLAADEAIAMNNGAARWDGIDRIESDGTVVYTSAAREAMAEIGHQCDSVTIDDLPEQSRRLQTLYDSLTTPR
jgi:hypothetical protein